MIRVIDNYHRGSRAIAFHDGRPIARRDGVSRCTGARKWSLPSLQALSVPPQVQVADSQSLLRSTKSLRARGNSLTEVITKLPLLHARHLLATYHQTLAWRRLPASQWWRRPRGLGLGSSLSWAMPMATPLGSQVCNRTTVSSMPGFAMLSARRIEPCLAAMPPRQMHRSRPCIRTAHAGLLGRRRARVITKNQALCK